MPIRYKFDILEKLKEKGFTTYKLRNEKILSQSTIKCLQNNEPVSFDTLAKLCEIFDMQPFDIIEYVPKENPNPDPSSFAEFIQEDQQRQKEYEHWYQEKYGK